VQPAHDGSRQHVVEDAAGAVVQGRIGLQDQALRTPELFSGKIGDPGAAARVEGPPIIEHGVDLLVVCDRPYAISREPYDWPRLAQFFVCRKRILAEFAANGSTCDTGEERKTCSVTFAHL
jgi:hypothetical protein